MPEPIAPLTPAAVGDTCKNVNTSAAALQPGQRVEVPVVEERLRVEKRVVETGEVVVLVEPRAEEEVLDVPLAEEAVEVKRVPVNRFVERTEPVRQEGDVTILPVYEEVLVVEKRLMLKEEIHLVRSRVERHERQNVTLRKEGVRVLRTDAVSGAAPENPAP